MAKPASCHMCVYAHWDPDQCVRTLWTGFPARPMCGNQPDAPGRMKACWLGRVCRNYRPRPPTPTGENVRLIPLNHGFYAYVDAADFEWLSQWNWHVCGGMYAGRHKNGRLVYMHREIMKPPKGRVVDHINGNRCDNTRANMRNVTRRENLQNTGKRAGTASIYKGVAYDKRVVKWNVQIGWSGTTAHAGPFEDEAEAARAYDRMAVELFGENARLNFPEEWPPERRAQVYAAARAKRKALMAKAARAKLRKAKGRQRKNRRAARRPRPRVGKRRERTGRTRSIKPRRGGG